jgi:predicted RNA polymerase sigma factor
MDTRQAVERVARASYGRLLAFLAARSRDVASAEDGLADAFHAALETWPVSGIPDQPEAWLLTSARRRLIDEARHADVHARSSPQLVAAALEAQRVSVRDPSFPDERLKMLFLCAHPAIDVAMHTPLMLQAVLGLDAARIASAFLIPPTTMGQRLSRAKAKIRDAGITFDVPDLEHLGPRLAAVLHAIYAAYGSGWDGISGADPRHQGLTREAIDLGRTLAALMPQEPEALGLVALMLHCEARRQARRSAQGAYVPLSDQDVSQWSLPLIAEAERALAAAAAMGRLGRFQLEAAIQSLHAQRAVTGRTDWEEIALHYEGLVRIAPSLGALVGRAAALAEARGAVVGWEQVSRISLESVQTYQPYWALVAHLHGRLGMRDAAVEAYGRAIGLCADQAIREYLLRGLASIRQRHP